jgi:hypothetical protein
VNRKLLIANLKISLSTKDLVATNAKVLVTVMEQELVAGLAGVKVPPEQLDKKSLSQFKNPKKKI